MNADLVQRKDAKLQRREDTDTNFTNGRLFRCAEGPTEISPGLERRDYPGKMSHTINLPLLLERGEGRREESSCNAYEFAGRLLVPPEPLRETFQAAIQSAQAAGYSDWLAADEAALDYIATRIAPKFGVSAEAIAKRLRRRAKRGR